MVERNQQQNVDLHQKRFMSMIRVFLLVDEMLVMVVGVVDCFDSFFGFQLDVYMVQVVLERIFNRVLKVLNGIIVILIEFNKENKNF